VDDELLDEEEREEEEEMWWWWWRELLDIWLLTVDNCNWMSIMWSPSRMVRFSGAAPDRKSFT
jgi:hypothetical protein